MNRTEVLAILAPHIDLSSSPNFSGADLAGVDLSGSNLSVADLLDMR